MDVGVSVKRRSSQGLGQRHPKEDANRREYDVVHDSLWRLPGEMYPLPADAVGAVEVQFHIEGMYNMMSAHGGRWGYPKNRCSKEG